MPLMSFVWTEELVIASAIRSAIEAAPDRTREEADIGPVERAEEVIFPVSRLPLLANPVTVKDEPVIAPRDFRVAPSTMPLAVRERAVIAAAVRFVNTPGPELVREVTVVAPRAALPLTVSWPDIEALPVRDREVPVIVVPCIGPL